MEIESVEIYYFTEDKTDVPSFIIHWKGERFTTSVMTDNTQNRHYIEIAEWYKAQKKKPFKFDF